MTRASLREYAAVQRERDPQANRAEKHRFLDEVVAVTGIHRKAAIRLLRHAPRPAAHAGPGRMPPRVRPGGRRRGAVLWQATGRIGAHRLHPLCARAPRAPRAVRRTAVAPDVEKRLHQASLPTLARLLAPARAQNRRRGATTTRPGTWLKR